MTELLSVSAPLAWGQRRTTHLALILLLAIPLFLVGLRGDTPYNNAEERCLAIARNMLRTGDYLVPAIDGHPHLTKPPLYHWCSATVGYLRGQVDLYAVRLPSALASVLLVVVLYLLGRILFSATAGLWAALLALTTYGVLDYAHRAMFDAMLTAFVCLALLGYVLVRQGARPGLGYGLLIAGLAGGFMAKGWLAWLVPLLPIGTDSWRRGRAGLRWRPVVGVAAGVLLLCLPWYVYLVTNVPRAARILQEVVTVNFGVKSKSYGMAQHHEPLLFYFYKTPLLLLPWLVLAVPVARRLWQERRGLFRRPEGMLLVWLIGGMLLLTLVPAKATRYAVPLLPAWCLLAGAWLAKLKTGEGEDRRWLRSGLYLLAGVMVLFGLALPAWLWVRLGVQPVLALVFAGLCLAVGLVCWRACTTGQWRRAAFAVVVWMALLCPLYFANWYPAHNFLRRYPESPEHHRYEARVDLLRDWFHGD